MSYFENNKTSIKSKLQPLEQYCEEIWVFGSCLNKMNPNDLDVVLVYKEENSKYIKDIKNKIMHNPPFHFTCLTIKEMQEEGVFTKTVKTSGVLLFFK